MYRPAMAAEHDQGLGNRDTGEDRRNHPGEKPFARFRANARLNAYADYGSRPFRAIRAKRNPCRAINNPRHLDYAADVGNHGASLVFEFFHQASDQERIFDCRNFPQEAARNPQILGGFSVHNLHFA